MTFKKKDIVKALQHYRLKTQKKVDIDDEGYEILKSMLEKLIKTKTNITTQKIIKNLNKIVLNNEEIDFITQINPKIIYESQRKMLIIDLEEEYGTTGKEVEFLMYLGYVGMYDGYYIFKFGYTADLKKRIKAHAKTYGMFQLIYSEYYYPKTIKYVRQEETCLRLYKTEIEKAIKNELRKINISKIPFMNGRKRSELLGIKDLSDIDKVLVIIENLISSFEHPHIKELKKRYFEMEEQNKKIRKTKSGRMNDKIEQLERTLQERDHEIEELKDTNSKLVNANMEYESEKINNSKIINKIHKKSKVKNQELMV